MTNFEVPIPWHPDRATRRALRQFSGSVRRSLTPQTLDPTLPVPFGLVGDLPAGLSNPTGMASHDRQIYVVDFTSNKLWRIDPDNPSSTAGRYGEVGDLPAGRSTGIASHDGSLYTIEGNFELWRINPDNLSDTSGTYGRVGRLPTRNLNNRPAGIASHNGSLYWFSVPSERMWRLNPANPSDASGTYGIVGGMPGGYNPRNGAVGGFTSHDGSLYACDDDLWRIDPDNPSSTAGNFGLVGDLPAGLSNPTGMASHKTRLYIISRIDVPRRTFLWLVNPANPGQSG